MPKAVEYKLWEEDFQTYNFQITSQKSIAFPDFVASNGIRIKTCVVPEWAVTRSDNFYLRGTNKAADDRVLKIPKAEWSRAEKALKEFNDKYSTEPILTKGQILKGECRCDSRKTIQFEYIGNGGWKGASGSYTLGTSLEDILRYFKTSMLDSMRKLHSDYTNWKIVDVEKWEIGDLLVGECKCSPTKTLTFKFIAPGKFELQTSFRDWKVGDTQTSYKNKEKVDLEDIACVFAYDIRAYFGNWRRVPKTVAEIELYTFSKSEYNCDFTESEIRITRKLKPSRYTFELTIEERQNVPSWMEKLVV